MVFSRFSFVSKFFNSYYTKKRKLAKSNKKQEKPTKNKQISIIFNFPIDYGTRTPQTPRRAFTQKLKEIVAIFHVGPAWILKVYGFAKIKGFCPKFGGWSRHDSKKYCRFQIRAVPNVSLIFVIFHIFSGFSSIFVDFFQFLWKILCFLRISSWNRRKT